MERFVTLVQPLLWGGISLVSWALWGTHGHSPYLFDRGPSHPDFRRVPFCSSV